MFQYLDFHNNSRAKTMKIADTIGVNDNVVP